MEKAANRNAKSENNFGSIFRGWLPANYQCLCKRPGATVWTIQRASLQLWDGWSSTVYLTIIYIRSEEVPVSERSTRISSIQPQQSHSHSNRHINVIAVATTPNQGSIICSLRSKTFFICVAVFICHIAFVLFSVPWSGQRMKLDLNNPFLWWFPSLKFQ